LDVRLKLEVMAAAGASSGFRCNERRTRQVGLPRFRDTFRISQRLLVTAMMLVVNLNDGETRRAANQGAQRTDDDGHGQGVRSYVVDP
jgi:hypothetical protein